jgi:hypothetical protein
VTRTALGAAVLLLLPAPAAAADTYACRSLQGDPPATFGFTLSHSSDAYAILGASLEVEGGVGYATAPAGTAEEALVDEVAVAPEAAAIGFALLRAEAGYGSDPVARIRLVTLSTDTHTMTAGVLQVTGGGLWPMLCDSDHGR